MNLKVLIPVNEQYESQRVLFKEYIYGTNKKIETTEISSNWSFIRVSETMFILIQSCFMIRDLIESMRLSKRIKPKETFQSEYGYNKYEIIYSVFLLYIYY